MSDSFVSEGNSVDLSVIIVNWNTKELTAQCLNSVIENLSNIPISYEIIVVDNASSDGSAQAIARDFSLVRLICNDENMGYGKANNKAATLAKGRYFLLLNSDTRLLDDSMNRIVGYMDKHPEVGVATGKVLNPDQTFQPPYRRFPGLVDAVCNHTINKVFSLHTRFLKHHKYEDLDPNQIHNVDSVTGAYLFVRSSLIIENKIFDEEIFMYYEDTLLCNDIRKRGYQVVYLPYAPIIHYHGMSARQVQPDAIFNSYRGSVVYIRKVYSTSLADRYSKTVKFIWRVLAIGFGLLRFIPIPKFREKASLFESLLEKSY